MFSSVPFRLAKRFAGYATQIAKDIPWHVRMSATTSRSILARFAEQSYLLVSSSVCAEDYYHLGLSERTIAISTKRTFLGSYEKWRYFNVINPAVYDVLARDKALYHILAHNANLPTPTTLATIAPGRKPHFGRIINTAHELCEFLSAGPAEHLFFKPADGSLGEGAVSIGRYDAQSETWELLPEKSPISLDQLIERLTLNGDLVRVLVQERLRPHPAMALVLPDVCPTVRYMTLHTASGIEHLGAALRIGSGHGPTDNLAGGGLIAPIDLATGNVLATISLAQDTPEPIARHPVTLAPVTELKIPDWQALRELIDRSAAAFNFLPCIGWDIGITDKGPVVIEINTRPRCISVQSLRPTGLLDSALGRELAKGNSFLETGIRTPKT